MNYYEQQYPLEFFRLKTIINQHIYQYVKILHRKENLDLLQWINNVVNDKLSDPFYKINTKCYWILNGLVDFPICIECCKQIKHVNVKITHKYPQFCSQYCVRHSIITKEKREITCKKLYGNENVFSKLSTKFEHKYDNISKKLGYTITNSTQIPGVKEKIQLTLLNTYGVKNISQIESVKHKVQNTNIEKYGTVVYFASDDFKDKAKKTKLQKYGNENYRNDEQRIQTNIEKYGYEHPMQNCTIRIKTQHKYKYNNQYFDSAPELALYIYLVDNNIQFEYQPICDIKYTVDNKLHQYFPDFKIENTFIEIKGNQFLKSDGSWQCPWNHQYDELYEAKHQCALKNNVKILYTNDYKIYLDYIEQQYEKNYLKQFKQ